MIKIPSWTQVEIGLAKAAAVASAVEGSTNLGGIPSSVRVALLAVAGAIISVNHYFNRTTTAVPATPPVTKP